MPYFKLTSAVFILALSLFNTSGGYTHLTVESGGGYSSNLYADSFSLGDSYLFGGVSLSNIAFEKTRLKTYYDLLYYNYDSRNSINQFDHLAGISVYRKRLNERVNWSIDLAGTYRDYTQGDSDYDNYNLFINANLSYYAITGLQLRLIYQLKGSKYSGFDDLNHTEHWLKGGAVKTLATKTTLRGVFDYHRRYFSHDESEVDWYNFEFKASQSIDIRTGISAGSLIRFTGNGTRPLSSYYIVSGVTPYWDPWDGYQINAALKRILPWGVVSTADFDYWHRQFKYSEDQQSEFPWLAGINERNDNGWGISVKFDKQINFFKNFLKTARISISTGYIFNDSDELYYEYDNYQASISLKVDIK